MLPAYRRACELVKLAICKVELLVLGVRRHAFASRSERERGPVLLFCTVGHDSCRTGQVRGRCPQDHNALACQ